MNNTTTNKIISVRENHSYAERAIDYFSSKWSIDRRIYDNAITFSLKTESLLPQWYLMLNGKEEIIGSYGLITNDFISRMDLCPWLCALFVGENMRAKGFGSNLLSHARKEAKKLNYSALYLCTDHIGMYEKCGWNHIGEGYHPWGASSQIYEIETL